MNPAEETNLRAEVTVLRELIKCMIAQMPDDHAVTDALDATVKRVVEIAPPLTQERVALQRAVNFIAPMAIKRRRYD